MIPKNIIEIGRKKVNKDCNIVRGNVVAIAFTRSNHIITLETNRRRDVIKLTDHAEEFLVRKLRKMKAKERLGYIEVLVMRFSTANGITIAKPCKPCSRILSAYGIDRVSYTDRGGEVQKLW
jgi:tRNA(Arg) A34 adenosine deaminase TadA